MEVIPRTIDKGAEFKKLLFYTWYSERGGTTTPNKIDFCAPLEMVLLDFGIIAGPLYRQNRDVKEAAKIYETVIQSTAPAIRPFIAIQMKLRGDENYKKHYRYLLMHFHLLGGLQQYNHLPTFNTIYYPK